VVPGGGASGCDCTLPAEARPARQRTVGRRQQAALRQFRHFLFVVRHRLIAAGNVAGRPRLIGKDVADLRARGRRKRDRRSGDKGRKTGQGNGSKHLAGFKRRIGFATLYISRSQTPGLTRRIRRGKGGLPPLRAATRPFRRARSHIAGSGSTATGQRARQMK